MKKSAPLVSIIIPVYNDAKYLERCIKSIEEQSFSNFECIIVDDGSTDNSREIISKYLKDTRFRYVYQDNAGPAKARMTGLGDAKSQYVMFADGDDWLAPNMMYTLYNEILNDSADIVSCGYFIDRPDGSKTIPKVGSRGIYSSDEAMFCLHNNKSVYGSVWNKIYDKKVITPDCFPPVHFSGQDYYMISKALMNCSKIVHMDVPLYHYIQNADGISKVGYGKNYTNVFKWLNMLKDELVKAYPNISKYIISYHVSIELMTLNSILRSDNCDVNLLKQIRVFLKDNQKIFLKNPNYSIVYKMSVFLAANNWRLYSFIYRKLHGSKLYYLMANDY